MNFILLFNTERTGKENTGQSEIQVEEMATSTKSKNEGKICNTSGSHLRHQNTWHFA